MIKVTYYKDYNRITMYGHAKSGVPGQDLVCAGASTLAYTLAANVCNLDKKGLIRDTVIKLEPGKAEISFQPRRKYAAVTALVMNTVCAGFELLARDNPTFISYEMHGSGIEN